MLTIGYTAVASPGVDGQKGPRLQFNSRQSSTVDTVNHSAHSISKIPPNIRRIFPAGGLPLAGGQSTPGLGEDRPLQGDRVASSGLIHVKSPYSHDGPIRRRKRGYVATMDQSDAVSVGIFPRWTVSRPTRRGPG
eukprot:4176128-Pyramimonas_sp.AAC.1